MSVYTDAQWIDWIDQLADRDYVVLDDFLRDKDYEVLRSFLFEKMEEDQFRQAGIGSIFQNQTITAIRGDYTYWIDRNRDLEIQAFFSLIDETLEKLNRYCFLSLSGFEFHFAHYPVGTFYKRHLDKFKDRSNRMISMIIYFNQDWKHGDGGELKIYHNEKEVIIPPLANRCVIFKSTLLEHEVMLSHADRYSVTGWLLHQPSGVGYILG